MSGLISAAVELGGILVAPEHTIMQRLAERRISPQTQAVFDIQPHGNGWKYPTPGGAYRWKNAGSKAADKYLWLNGKPQGENFYHAQDLASEIAQAGGACWFVSGEADTWAMYSAGIRHVLSGFTESAVSENLAEYLANMGATVLYIAPDLDPTGARWARLVAQALQDSPIELDARNLPPELGDKADLGRAWAIYPKRQSFERYLLGLPRFYPEPLPEPQPATRNQAQAVNRSAIPQEYKDLIADILQATDYQGDGFTAKNVCCPFHDDKHPSASLHSEKGLYCHACGRWYSWNETGIKIGAGSLREWRLANDYAMSTEVREGLIKAGHSSLARLLDVLSLAGWQTGKEFTRKDVLTVAQDLLTGWTIRQATNELESYCGFFPPLSLQPVKQEKNRKKSRPQKVYRLPSPAQIAEKLQVCPLHFDEMNPQKIRQAADYRAEVYAALPRRKPGQYARKTLAGRVGVTNRTGQDYDKRAGLIVTPNIGKDEMTHQELADLPEQLPEKRKYNAWLEDERGNKYPPIKKAIDMIARCGGGKVYRIEQFANTYQPGKE